MISVKKCLLNTVKISKYRKQNSSEQNRFFIENNGDFFCCQQTFSYGPSIHFLKHVVVLYCVISGATKTNFPAFKCSQISSSQPKGKGFNRLRFQNCKNSFQRPVQISLSCRFRYSIFCQNFTHE